MYTQWVGVEDGVNVGSKVTQPRQVKSTGFPNTLVPCQPAQMTDTACLFLAASFSWRSSLLAWWKSVAVVEEVSLSDKQDFIVPGEVLSTCEAALLANIDRRRQHVWRRDSGVTPSTVSGAHAQGLVLEGACYSSGFIKMLTNKK